MDDHTLRDRALTRMHVLNHQSSWDVARELGRLLEHVIAVRDQRGGPDQPGHIAGDCPTCVEATIQAEFIRNYQARG